MGQGLAVPTQLQQIIVFSTRRYQEYRDQRPRLAQAFLAIAQRATDVQYGAGDMNDLMSFLSEPQADPNLAKAAAVVLTSLGYAT